jgi:hypothetical protein
MHNKHTTSRSFGAWWCCLMWQVPSAPCMLLCAVATAAAAVAEARETRGVRWRGPLLPAGRQTVRPFSPQHLCTALAGCKQQRRQVGTLRRPKARMPRRRPPSNTRRARLARVLRVRLTARACSWTQNNANGGRRLARRRGREHVLCLTKLGGGNLDPKLGGCNLDPELRLTKLGGGASSAARPRRMTGVPGSSSMVITADMILGRAELFATSRSTFARRTTSKAFGS